MNLKEKYIIKSIDNFQCKDWLINKHYAKRMPSIEYSFGIYDGIILIGVCTFGCPPRVMNNGESIFKEYRVKTLELNRLVINEGREKNILSFFVSTCLKRLPVPCCVVSYADDDFGHKGYIYQATNWLYAGLNNVHQRKILLNGKELHPRTACSMGYTNISEWANSEDRVELGDYMFKHRYFKLLGSKKDIKKMRAALIYKLFPYPKGDNKRYDASYKPHVQIQLF